jgi:hypothetical protein
MRRALGRSLLCLLLCGVALPASPEPPAVTLSLNTHVGSAPFTVRAKITVAKNEHNRHLLVEWFSNDYSGSGSETLDGAAAAITYWRDITIRASGVYELDARVDRDDNQFKLSNIETIYVN